MLRGSHIVSNVFLGAYFILWAYFHFQKLSEITGIWKASEALLILQAFLLGIFFMIRRPAKVTSWKIWDVIVAVLGTLTPFLFIPTKEESMHLTGFVIQVIGSCMTIYAFLSLNRSWGILASNRKVQTKGMYRLVRHPVYMSYQIFNIGYIFNHAGLYNGAVVILCLLSQILRISTEEKLLSQDPEYLEYKKKVKWRLIPLVS